MSKTPQAAAITPIRLAAEEALRCLYLECHQIIADDVKAKVYAWVLENEQHHAQALARARCEAQKELIPLLLSLDWGFQIFEPDSKFVATEARRRIKNAITAIEQQASDAAPAWGGETMNTYLCSYTYKQARWDFEIKADSWGEAQERLQAIQRAVGLDGELVISVPIPSLSVLRRKQSIQTKGGP